MRKWWFGERCWCGKGGEVVLGRSGGVVVIARGSIGFRWWSDWWHLKTSLCLLLLTIDRGGVCFISYLANLLRTLMTPNLGHLQELKPILFRTLRSLTFNSLLGSLQEFKPSSSGLYSITQV